MRARVPAAVLLLEPERRQELLIGPAVGADALEALHPGKLEELVEARKEAEKAS